VLQQVLVHSPEIRDGLPEVPTRFNLHSGCLCLVNELLDSASTSQRSGERAGEDLAYRLDIENGALVVEKFKRPLQCLLGDVRANDDQLDECFQVRFVRTIGEPVRLDGFLYVVRLPNAVEQKGMFSHDIPASNSPGPPTGAASVSSALPEKKGT
jgi:hypothetical protein